MHPTPKVRRPVSVGTLIAAALAVLCVVSCLPTPYYRTVMPDDWLRQGIAPKIRDVAFDHGCFCIRESVSCYPAIDGSPGWRWNNVFSNGDRLMWEVYRERDQPGWFVVNPAARNDKSSPIYGMPILNADQAKSVIVLKRSMNPGFAGIENELFYDPRTSMLFGDAKASLSKLVAEIKTL